MRLPSLGPAPELGLGAGRGWAMLVGRGASVSAVASETACLQSADISGRCGVGEEAKHAAASPSCCRVKEASQGARVAARVLYT